MSDAQIVSYLGSQFECRHERGECRSPAADFNWQCIRATRPDQWLCLDQRCFSWLANVQVALRPFSNLSAIPARASLRASLLRGLKRQIRSHPDQLRIVHKEYAKGHASDGSERLHLRTIPGEMPVPLISSRMKQSGQLSCVRVDPRNVRALIPIAVDTCQRKVFEFIRAAVLSRNDVVCLEWRRMHGRRQLTVFATSRSPCTDLPSRFSVHRSYSSVRCKDRLALERITASRLLTWM